MTIQGVMQISVTNNFQTSDYLSSTGHDHALAPLEVQLLQHHLALDERLQRHPLVGVREDVQ